MSLVWDNFPHGGSEKLVMLAMADWSNDAGSHCYPSVKKVSEKCNVSECQARRILHKLINEGYLSVVGNESGGGNNSRQYQVNVSAVSTSTHASPSTDASPSTHARGALAPMHVSTSTHASLSVNNSQLSVNNPFAVFWKAYPKKKSKGQAEKAFKKLSLDDILFNKIISAIDKAKASEQWGNDDGKYIPYPATWLNVRGWEDETTEPKSKYKDLTYREGMML